MEKQKVTTTTPVEGQTTGRVNESPGGFANTYGVDLLFSNAPTIDNTAIFAALRSSFDAVSLISRPEEFGFLPFAFSMYAIACEDAALHAQCFVAVCAQPYDLQAVSAALEQTWDWPHVSEIVQQCRSSVLVMSMTSSGFEYKGYLTCFHKVLSSVLRVLKPLAIHWPRSQLLIAPDTYEAFRQTQSVTSLHGGPLNVRLFNVANRICGDMIMDTRGLTAFGLPDVQCHFRGLDLNAVAHLLYNVGIHLFDQGDVIADGDTITGVKPEQKWLCRHEIALTPPSRAVLNIDPGRPYTAR